MMDLETAFASELERVLFTENAELRKRVSLLLLRVESREQEKASLLRASKLNEAMAIQARIDGLMEALASLDKTIVELQSKQDDTPLY